MKYAACLGKAPNKRANPNEPDPWFPAKGESPNVGRIHCFTCSVRVQCKEYRERTESEYGMWAGEIPKRDNGK